MIKLHYSFEIMDALSENEDGVLNTISYFSKNPKHRSAFADTIADVKKAGEWLETLGDKNASISLDNGVHSVNFTHLRDSIESNLLMEIYLSVKNIRQELLVIATKETFEEFKNLTDFWEYIELPIQQLLK